MPAHDSVPVLAYCVAGLQRFAAVIMRIREPKTTALIFASGKMVCTGAKSEGDSRLAAKKYCRIVQRTGFSEVRMKEFKIQNIVGSCDVKFPIRLEGLAYAHGYFATYEPEIFPGLIYRMKQPKIVLLIFVSGKVVLTGAKHRDEIYQAFENIYPILREFRKRSTTEAAGLAALTAPGQAGAAAGDKDPKNAAAAGTSGTAAGGLASSGSMLPPPARRVNSAMPPPAPTPVNTELGTAAAADRGAPVATPAQAPPATPAHVPPATPAYVPPATPAYMPAATPAYVPPAATPLGSVPSLKAPGMPGTAMAPPLPRQPNRQQ
eukprot:GHRR01011664.1.p1 GENE.GHRR01011664.1~~GHRR01011664.1.p1  ORF type:complete len:320 (+),score=125.04 GHRR01011664.1:572-1531(+)